LTDDEELPLAHGFSLARLGQLARANVVWILLVPLGLFSWIVVHESAHAVAIVAQGGAITVFDVIPGGEETFTLGHVEQRGNLGTQPALAALAPTIVWTSFAFATVLSVSLFGDRNPMSKGLVLFGFFVPGLDASLEAAGLFCGAEHSDWYRALHGLEAPMSILFALTMVFFAELGLSLVRKVWGQDALSGAEFCVLFLVVMAVPWLRYVLF
jgi:hypothetical protein